MTPTVPRRIAVGSIFIECNQFGGVPADLARFEQCELQRNRDVLTMTNGVVGGCLGQTEGKGAFPELAQMTREFKQLPGVIATALTITHPYLDFARMGGGALVVTDNNLDPAIHLSRQIADLCWRRCCRGQYCHGSSLGPIRFGFAILRHGCRPRSSNELPPRRDRKKSNTDHRSPTRPEVGTTRNLDWQYCWFI